MSVLRVVQEAKSEAHLSDVFLACMGVNVHASSRSPLKGTGWSADFRKAPFRAVGFGCVTQRLIPVRDLFELDIMPLGFAGLRIILSNDKCCWQCIHIVASTLTYSLQYGYCASSPYLNLS